MAAPKIFCCVDDGSKNYELNKLISLIVTSETVTKHRCHCSNEHKSILAKSKLMDGANYSFPGTHCFAKTDQERFHAQFVHDPRMKSAILSGFLAGGFQHIATVSRQSEDDLGSPASDSGSTTFSL